MGLESEYANCKTLYVLPPAGYDTQESNVPVMVRIGRSAGKYRDDTSDVFEKLGASYQKMAISLDDDVTECPVEVKDWDVTRQLGILFVKIPFVPTTGMTLKLWYDSTHADNTTNVGAIGSAVGQSVWANGFEGVWHMKPSGGLVLDSTANGNHGTIYGATETDGPLGRCLLFDGVGNYVNCGANASLELGDLISVDICMKIGIPNTGAYFVLSKEGGFRVFVDTSRLAMCVWGSESDIPSVNISHQNRDTNSYEQSTFVVDQGILSSYHNGIKCGSRTYVAPRLISPQNLVIGASSSLGNHTPMECSEIRLSSVARSPAWIALTNASLKDELIAFSTPGTESLTGNERMRLKPDGTLIADEFVEV